MTSTRAPACSAPPPASSAAHSLPSTKTRPEPASNAVAALEWHERFGMLRAEAIEMRARLAAQME